MILCQTCLHANEFVNRWAFQNAADLVYDNTHDELSSFDEKVTFDPAVVKEGSTIFVRRDSLYNFVHDMHPKINAHYILITHVDDPPVPDIFAKLLDDPKLIAWFGIHPAIKHPKFYPIPIGIFPHKILKTDSSKINGKLLGLNKTVKDKLLYMNFSLWTNRAVRTPIRDFFINKPYCFTVTNKISNDEYLAQMAQFKFVLSPPGNGIDCYRTWEALAVGCIPVVKSSNLDVIYKDLPVLIVEDWTKITKEFLLKKYSHISMGHYNFNILFMDYWVDKIKQVKANFINKQKRVIK